jgi:hypothetical protein
MDMRKVFEDKEIDAVSVGTPNHWHALGTIWACIRKHVYVRNLLLTGYGKDANGRSCKEIQCTGSVGLQNRSIPCDGSYQFLHYGGIVKYTCTRIML